MRAKQTISGLILEGLLQAAFIIPQLLPRPFETKYAWARRLKNIDPHSYDRTVERMRSRNLVRVVEKNGQRFLQLTDKGEIEALLKKAALQPVKVWDGKWRLFIFDIPESSKDKRNILRQLLKRNNFYKLQASVYINPYPLNREAISYLQRSGLIDYIRILKVEEMDNDKKLLNFFRLKKPK